MSKTAAETAEEIGDIRAEVLDLAERLEKLDHCHDEETVDLYLRAQTLRNLAVGLEGDEIIVEEAG